MIDIGPSARLSLANFMVQMFSLGHEGVVLSPILLKDIAKIAFINT